MRTDVKWCKDTGQQPSCVLDYHQGTTGVAKRWRNMGKCPVCHRRISLGKEGQLLPHSANIKYRHRYHIYQDNRECTETQGAASHD